MRRNISTVPDYVNCHAFFIGSGNFTINDAVYNAHNHYDNYANGDNHSDIYIIIYGHAGEFGASNVYFSTGHAGADANNDKREYNA